MCSCSLFLLPLFTLVAASMSHFLTGAITFSCFSSDKIGLLCFFFYLSVFSLTLSLFGLISTNAILATHVNPRKF